MILLFSIFSFLSILLPILLSVAFLTLLERKCMASVQRRKGPNVVGFVGHLQPLADGLKLFLKELLIPYSSSKFMFLLAPILTLALSLLGWAIIPFTNSIALTDLDLGILYIFAISSLNVYGIVMAGWSSNSKYAFLGGLRSAAQMISYEVSIGLIILSLIIFVGSLDLFSILDSQNLNCSFDFLFFFTFFLIFLMFFISSFAETNRPPFDLPEAEAELVAGYNVEYSAVNFAFFFIGEYANIILMSSLVVILFFNGNDSCLFYHFSVFSLIFAIKTLIFLLLFILVRAAVPRYRYDQLMNLGWKLFLPLSISFFLLFSFIFMYSI
jgi:NADH-quinone oxidoreductase subunit H